VEFSPAPFFDLEEEFLLQTKLLNCIQNGYVESAHDVSEGGLFITLAECGFHKEVGFDVICQHKKIRRDAFWFGESQSRVVVSIKKEKQVDFLRMMEGITIEKLGEVTSSVVEVDGEKWGDISEWKYEYETAIEKEMESIVEV
jgi:phosphoribosylformylglycinamidine synthase